MNWLNEYLRRLRSFLFSTQVDRESTEEFAHHIDMQTEKNIATGMDPTEARRHAELAFGNVASTRERTREQRGALVLEDMARDASQGVRQLFRQPLFSATTILTIALGIGSVTAIWSVVDGVLLRPAPVKEIGRLVMVWQTDRRSETQREPASWPDYQDVVTSLPGLSEVAAFSGQERTLRTPDGENRRLVAMGSTSNYLDVLGLTPVLGRVFSGEEEAPGGPAVVVLGEQLWRSSFGADSAILGQTIHLDDVAHQVVGIAPSSASFGLDQIHGKAAYHSTYVGGQPIDVWLPMQADEEAFPRDTHPFLILGRLEDGTSLDTLQASATTLGSVLGERFPTSNVERGFYIESLDAVVFATVRPAMLLLVGAVFLMATVAFVNVTNLLLARGATRRREFALRTALGAGTLRLARQLFVENAILTAAGTVLGVGLAFAILNVLLNLAPPDIPRLETVAINPRVLAVALVVASLGALLFGLVPTLQARRINVARSMGGSGRGNSGDKHSALLRRTLVVSELAMSVALIVFAGLLLRSQWEIAAVDPGFETERVIKAQFQLPTSRYPRDFSVWPNLKEVHGFRSRLLARLEELPGIASVALAGEHPLDGGFTNSFEIAGRESETWPEISVRRVSPNYFETLGLQVLLGRPLDAGDRTDASAVALINRASADRLFRERDPLGQSIRFWGTSRRIVGVVENERIHGVTNDIPLAIYTPLAQVPAHTGVLLARSEGSDPMILASGIVGAIHDIDPGLAVFGVEPLAETLSSSTSERRFTMLVLIAMAASTLTLALFGVHGMLAYSAAQRTREMGIRTALGAQAWEIQRLVIRSGLTMAVAGIALGLTMAAMAGRLVASLLFRVQPFDLSTFVAVPLAVLAVAALASWLPARRASGKDTVTSLRIG